MMMVQKKKKNWVEAATFLGSPLRYFQRVLLGGRLCLAGIAGSSLAGVRSIIHPSPFGPPGRARRQNCRYQTGRAEPYHTVLDAAVLRPAEGLSLFSLAALILPP